MDEMMIGTLMLDVPIMDEVQMRTKKSLTSS